MKNMWIWIIGGVVILGGLFLLMNKPSVNTTIVPRPNDTTSGDTVTPMETSTMMESSVMLAEQNTSGESGTAALKEENGKVVVTINMTGAPATAQPAHIHAGACPTPGAVEYPLSNVVNGMSVTTLDVTMADLKAKLPLAINVHKSAAESGVYVACGDLSL